jgi:hypothetical protein
MSTRKNARPAKRSEKARQERPLPVELASLKDAIDRDNRRFYSAVDSEYWYCVSFESREQKEAFLKAMGWFDLGDKYLDGNELAERLGIALPEAHVPYLTQKPDATLDTLALPLVPQEPPGRADKG